MLKQASGGSYCKVGPSLLSAACQALYFPPHKITLLLLRLSALQVTKSTSMAVQEERIHLPHTQQFVTVLHNVYSQAECQALIDLSEQQFYIPATVTGEDDDEVHDTRHRDSDRCMLDDPARAAELFRRVAPYLPGQLEGCSLAGINERLRFLRYGPGQKFSPHFDGCFERPDGSEASLMTILLYLSGGPGQLTGGETIFMDDWKQVHYRLEPQPGLVLAFEHEMLHEGRPVQSGRKYCIRSDIMYRTQGGAAA